MNSTIIAAAAAEHHNDLLAEGADARRARVASAPRQFRPFSAKRRRRVTSPGHGLRTWLAITASR